MGGELVRDLKKAWGSPTPSRPPRFCQRQVGCACVLAHDSQRWDLARDASELEVEETRQRPCPDQGGKEEGTQVLEAKCSPATTVSQKSLKESSLDLAREICWLPKGCQVPRSLDKSEALREARCRAAWEHSCPVGTGRLSSWPALSRMAFRILRRCSRDPPTPACGTPNRPSVCQQQAESYSQGSAV